MQDYKGFFEEEAMASNKDIAAKYEDFNDFEDDFM